MKREPVKKKLKKGGKFYTFYIFFDGFLKCLNAIIIIDLTDC